MIARRARQQAREDGARRRLRIDAHGLGHTEGGKPFFRSASVLAAASALLETSNVYAGDMDAVGVAILALGGFMAIIVAAGIAAIVACRRIGNPWSRAVVRLAIVVMLCTPVPHGGLYDQIVIEPGFLVLFESHAYWPHDGWLSRPAAFAYPLAFVLGLPAALLWAWLDQRYVRPRDASQAQRNSAAISASAPTPPTANSQ